MGVLVGLGLGVGLLLIWSAFAVPRTHRERRPGRLDELLARSGLGGVSVTGFIVLCLVCGVVSGVAIQIASRTVPVAIAFGVMGGYLPVAITRGRARRRQREFAEVWPEAVDNLASAVRAGMSLPEALSALSGRGPEPLRPAFAGFALDYQVTGRFGESLDRLKDRLADPVGDRVVEGLRVAREVGGGDLGRLLRSLSGFLRDDARTRSELESRQTWTVNSVHDYSPCPRPTQLCGSERIAAMTGGLVWFPGWSVVREPTAGILFRLALDVELVGIEDEVGASLPVLVVSPEERRAQVADSVHVLDAVSCCYASRRAISLASNTVTRNRCRNPVLCWTPASRGWTLRIAWD